MALEAWDTPRQPHCELGEKFRPIRVHTLSVPLWRETLNASGFLKYGGPHPLYGSQPFVIRGDCPCENRVQSAFAPLNVNTG